MRTSQQDELYEKFREVCRSFVGGGEYLGQEVNALTDTYLNGVHLKRCADGTWLRYAVTIEREEEDGTLTVGVAETIHHHDEFWGPGGIADTADPGRWAVIDGAFFTIGDGDGFGGVAGFGGKRWEIEFFDGRRVVTRDLWPTGQITPKWRERWPDNARFVKDESKRTSGQ